jgi:hypothetical protein
MASAARPSLGIVWSGVPAVSLLAKCLAPCLMTLLAMAPGSCTEHELDPRGAVLGCVPVQAGMCPWSRNYTLRAL